ncbi:MAG TPA: 50S ribosomal protein L10 [Conexivisphaerales archaeon]|nr:50S ribosomal protein L10 [Conexivisphaerales archaeon]
MPEAKKYPESKVKQYTRIRELASKYDVVALANLNKVRSTQIMELRRKFRGELVLAVAKNRIATKALDGVKKENLKGLDGSLTGQNLFLFTNMNPFKLNLLLEKGKIYLPAKAGDVASEEVVIPAGNTGIPPGPVLSEFKDSKVITKIESGSIWVTKDTVVAAPGDTINVRLASLLSKLGMKPIKAGMALSMVYWNGLLIAEKDVRLDIDAFVNEIGLSAREAFNVAFEAKYPAKEVLVVILVDSMTKALAVAAKANYVTKDTAAAILKNAELDAYKLLELTKEAPKQ